MCNGLCQYDKPKLYNLDEKKVQQIRQAKKRIRYEKLSDYFARGLGQLTTIEIEQRGK